MPNVTIALRRTKSEQEQPCTVCGAVFPPAEDSGSRILTVKAGDQEPLTGLICGGCHSKWTGGATITVKAAPLPPATT